MKERRRFRKGEEGYVLVYVTLVLVLTMIIIPPLLGFVGGAGRSAQIREDRMLQVYAADAGIEDGYYRLLGEGNSTQLPQNPEDDPWTGNISDINGYDVDIAVYREAGGVFKIVSTADNEYGGNVTIESWAAALDYSHLLDNALSSCGDITISPGTEVYGNVVYNDILNNKGVIDGNTTKGVVGWPDADDLKAFYHDDVEGQPSYGSDYIRLQHDDDMGPFYREGPLDIYSSNPTATLTLTGTVYVTGDLLIGLVDKDFILDLNGETIFCEQDIGIGGKCTITGSGCIIAVGDVYGSPGIISDEDDFVFVMSVSGDLQLQPNGDFYGSMAGNIEIDLQPGNTIIWRPYDIDLNFPTGSVTPGIRAYIIRN